MSGIEEAVMRNIQAVGELTEIVRTSFGPNGECGGFSWASVGMDLFERGFDRGG